MHVCIGAPGGEAVGLSDIELFVGEDCATVSDLKIAVKRDVETAVLSVSDFDLVPYGRPPLSTDDAIFELCDGDRLELVATPKAMAVQRLSVAGRPVSTEGLVEAVADGDITACEDLLAAGIDVNGTDADGWTPLYYATLLGKSEVADILLLNGAEIDRANSAALALGLGMDMAMPLN